MVAGSVGAEKLGTTSPPASGKNATRPRVANVAPVPMFSVSEPMNRPDAVAYTTQAPEPRGLRPGFQANGMPLTGSSATTPGRGTAPGPGESDESALFAHRWWPPT